MNQFHNLDRSLHAIDLYLSYLSSPSSANCLKDFVSTISIIILEHFGFILKHSTIGRVTELVHEDFLTFVWNDVIHAGLKFRPFPQVTKNLVQKFHRDRFVISNNALRFIRPYNINNAVEKKGRLSS